MTKMKLRLFFLMTVIVGLAISCTSTVNNRTEDPLNFQSDLDNQINENMPGLLVCVISKDSDINLTWKGAAGFSDKENNLRMLPDQTFRIASVTKTFVAATILRLWEDGRVKLEDPIEKFISDEHVKILEAGNYKPREITIYHLLTHSGGLSDHTDTEKYTMDFLRTNHVWSRTEQLSDLVNLKNPVGEPGEKFSYSDSGYILLGEIIETITQKPLGEAIIEQLNFEKLGITSTFMEDFEGDFSGRRIHQYYENEDTYLINPSADYFGGGGLLSTACDLSLFFQYLFENKIFHNKSTLDKMLSPVNYAEKPALDYRMGIWKTEINGMTAYTHTGFWGTQVIYIPEIKTSIAANYSQVWKVRGFAPVIPILLDKLLENNTGITLSVNHGNFDTLITRN
jgi:D-alanyl-D-alanine carboxypeptidase